jgi:hypothetical protein
LWPVHPGSDMGLGGAVFSFALFLIHHTSNMDEDKKRKSPHNWH